MHLPTHWLFLVFSLLTVSLYAKPFFLLLSEDHLKNSPGDSSEWDDEFGCSDSHKSDEELDSGSWRPIFEPHSSATGDTDPGSEADSVYYSGLSKMLKAVSSSGELSLMHEALEEIEAAVAFGHPHAMSVLGFLHGSGHMRERNKAKAFMYHFFAADGGNMQSKMALAFTYFKQEMYEKSAKLYSQLAEAAVNSFLIEANSPVAEPVSIHNEGEENKEALRKFRGEEDEDFQILKYQAEKGNASAMYKIGLFYYFGLSGLRRDHAKALSWFLKAVEKGDPRSMELLGEMYASGNGVERNHTKAFEWLTLAAEKELCSAYNGLGYLYLKGYGVEKNYSKAMEYFEKAVNNDEAGAYYNLGVMFLKGIGVKRDVKLATKYFIIAGNAGHEKAFYQLAKMFHSGLGLKKNLPTAVSLYKLVAEKGPWSSLSTWAVKSYLEGDSGKAFLLYSRMAELGYEVAQSNAAWILDKYGERSVCLGESGFCTVAERHQLAQGLWWHAYKQGNQYAAFLFAGTERDHDPGAGAYTNTTKVADVCGCESM